MKKFKNKFLMGFGCLIMIASISYQNCGQMPNTSPTSNQNKTTTMSSALESKDAEGESYTLVMKDGSRVKYEFPTKEKIYKIHLKDGRVFEYKIKTW